MSAQSAHTEGPWRWEFSAQSKSLHLVGGRPQFDLTIMDFVRCGMGGAMPRFREPGVDGMNIMHRLDHRADWLGPEPGRLHHKTWHQLVTHPDARLIQAAPLLLAALEGAVKRCEAAGGYVGQDGQFIKLMKAVVLEARPAATEGGAA